MKEELYVVDSSGKIVDKLNEKDKYVKLEEGDRVLKKGVIQYLSDTMNIKYHFVKVNPLCWSRIAVKYPIINKLICYLGYMDNILSYKNGKNIQVKDIAKLCGVSESTAKRQLKGLMQEDVVHKVRDKKQKKTFLVINPYVCMCSKRIYLSLYEEFKLSALRDEVEEWAKK